MKYEIQFETKLAKNVTLIMGIERKKLTNDMFF